MFLQIVSGIAMLVHLVLAAWVGGRILRRTTSARLRPERWIAYHLIFYWCLSGTVDSLLYTSWADPSLALADATSRWVNGISAGFGVVGALALFRFVHQTFRPKSLGARDAVLAAAVLLVLAWIETAVDEAFQLRVINGIGYWTQWLVKTSAFGWLAVESLGYRAQLRRRVVLGLVEPLVANRFLVWGMWAATGLALALSDPIARIAYVSIGGSTTLWDPALGKPIVDITLACVVLPQIVICGALFLTFFPTRAYARWIERRTAAATASE